MLTNTSVAGESAGKAMSRIYSTIGFTGLWNGLPVRIVMIGTLTAFQWLMYVLTSLYWTTVTGILTNAIATIPSRSTSACPRLVVIRKDMIVRTQIRNAIALRCAVRRKVFSASSPKRTQAFSSVS